MKYSCYNFAMGFQDTNLPAENLTVDQLVSTLRTLPAETFNPETIKNLLGPVSIEPTSLSPYLHWLSKNYTRNLVFRNEIFELLVLCWEPGSISPIHNHAGQDCWLHIHGGHLSLEDFTLVDPSQKHQVGSNIKVQRTERIRQASQGTLDHRGSHNEIHRVVNCRRFRERAVSIHLYATPFDQCIIYETQNKIARYLDLVYHTRNGHPA